LNHPSLLINLRRVSPREKNRAITIALKARYVATLMDFALYLHSHQMLA